MEGRARSFDQRRRTPRTELAKLRDARTEEGSRVAERIMLAMLEACGERGYRNVSVQHVIDRYGGNRSQFYSHFTSKSECYAAAWQFETRRRYPALLAAVGAETTRAERLLAGLRRLAFLLESNPPLARGLIVEVHVAGGEALRKREAVVEGLVRTLDRARADTPVRHTPPPLTARLMLGAIEALVTNALLRNSPHEFGAGLREIAQMILSAYLGSEVAAAEVDALVPGA